MPHICMRPFADRALAGRELALLLLLYRYRRDSVVVALPSSGVPVAFEVAHRLGLPLDVLIAADERMELQRRERMYHAGRRALDLRGRIVILVDDGADMDSRVHGVVNEIRKMDVQEIVVALPVASIQAYEQLRNEVERVVCIGTPEPFNSVSAWYDDFPEVSDSDILRLLISAGQERVGDGVTK